MLTGQIRFQIDSIWNDFWSGGVSNPLSVIEQITYLLFIKRLDDLQTVTLYRSEPARRDRVVRGGRGCSAHPNPP
jgi:type I restriction enzyme M protein